MNESSFYPKFPFIHSNDLDPYSGTPFNDAIVTKKEFAIERLPRVEPLPSKPGDYLHHQKYIARYMATYDELLLFHEPGTGKTCTAVAAVEALRYAKDKTISSAIVCAKGEGLTKNFLQELMFTCTDGKYVPENYTQLTEMQKAVRLKKSANSFYLFKTFETFAKDLAGLTDENIRKRYEDTIFILDEVHNIREMDETELQEDVGDVQKIFKKSTLNVYHEFHRLFHVLKRRKVILMTGTPIKDTADEFASLMNLILPMDRQIDVKNFTKKYFSNDVLTNRDELATLIRGRVSYVNAASTTVQKRFVGSVFGDLKHFVVSISTMGDFQANGYKNAYNEDKSIYIQARQASLFVFPDGSYGQKGFNRYVQNKKELFALMSEVRNNPAALHKYSAKYAQVIDVIKSSVKSKHFVYCQYVNGSGAIVFSKMLEAFGFKSAFGNETTKGLRYALCTRHTATPKQIQKLVNRFNSKDNVDGEYISVIIGSRVLNEGFTLKNIRNEFILTGHWNYAEVAQAIARGWRLGSHDYQLVRGDKDVHVDVYQCVSLAPTPVPSIDMELYATAERKDVTNRQIERLVKETAFDCPLAIDRNRITGYDGQRECDYQSCDYTCAGTIGTPLDESTFNMLQEVKDSVRNVVVDRLTDVFSTRSYYTIAELAVDVNQDNNHAVVVEAVIDLIKTAKLFYNAHGFPQFLRMSGVKLFLSTDPNSNTGLFSEIYTRVLEPEKKSFSEVLDEMYAKALPDLVRQLFENPEMVQKLIVQLPFRVQRLILQACIIARDKNIDKNVDIRNEILDFYRGFYDRVNGRWIIWLHSDAIGSVCYNGESFVECETPGTAAVSIKNSPVGWYGMYNPTNKDFCIRDVKELEAATGDLRRITVGKRCLNYDKSVLAGVLGRNIKIGDGNTDSEKFDYWRTTKSKVEMCDALKDWFENNNLMETNFDCGTSKKKRGKFA